MGEVLFYVFARGDPKTKGSPHMGTDGQGRSFLRTEPGLRAWAKDLRYQVLIARRGAAVIRDPVKVHLSFVLRRPKGHFRSDGATLNPRAPARPTAKMDLDKLERAALDGLVASRKEKKRGNERVLLDDSLVVEIHSRKVYGAEPGVRIWIESMTADELWANDTAARQLELGTAD
jgi:Holliday junction resolvase RusA-like endonuclease